MAKIYDFKSRKLLADVPLFTPVSEEILDSIRPLTKFELSELDNSIEESSHIINICSDKDEDVIEWHKNYLERCVNRIELSINSKKQA